MRPNWQRDVMRRVGVVLIAVGVVDIGACAVAVANRRGYGSSLNIFALVAGIMVYRGHLGTIRFVVRWFSFMLGALVLLPVALVVGEFLFRKVAPMPPMDAGRWAVGGASWVGFLALFYWVRDRLASLPVFEGDRPAKALLRMPDTAVGVGLAVFLIIVFLGVAVYHVGG